MMKQTELMNATIEKEQADRLKSKEAALAEVQNQRKTETSNKEERKKKIQEDLDTLEALKDEIQ